jgi:hypothetical protein
MSKISLRMEARVVAKRQKDQLAHLQSELLKLPQYEPTTNHHFANGMYLRTVWSPAGSVIVGKVHKTEHFYAVISGRVRVTTEHGVREFNATRDGPQILTCPIGTQRAVYVIEDAWRMNVHRNPDNITDIETLERELVEEDETCPFLPGNKLKQELLT